jgi:cyanophycinase
VNGLIALVGAGEYLPVMDPVDRQLLDSVQAQGRAPRVVCLATAAGAEGEASVGRWQEMGKRHFEALGASVEALPIVDKASAEDPRYESILAAADLIYFSGGNPAYLYDTMAGSRAWAAAQKAWERGAIYAGCSAGAMILAKHLPDFGRLGSGGRDGFGVLPIDYVMPHFDHTGPFKYVVGFIRRGLDENQCMVGIDENTALIGRIGGPWLVMGKGRVHLLGRKSVQSFSLGEVVPIQE